MGLGRSKSGVDWKMRDDGVNAQFLATQDVTALLDQNKAMATHNDGYSPTRELRRVASIPAIIASEWLTKHGVDMNNPDHWDGVKRLLNSNEYLYLRTAVGRL